MNLLILGAGGQAQVVADIALTMADAGAQIRIVGFLDDNPQLWGGTLFGAPIRGPIHSQHDFPFDAVIVSIGNNQIRMRLFLQWRQQGAHFATLIHPSAIVASNVKIGTGTVLCAGAIVNTGSHIGQNVILNTACSVGHHNRIGDHVHIGPGARVGGDVYVADEVFIGIGATLLPQLQIGRGARVGGGAVVIRPVDADQTVVGVPAHPLPHSIGG